MSPGKAIAGIAALSILTLSIGAVALATGPARAASPEIVFSGAGDFGSWGGFNVSLDLLKGTGSDFAFALGDLSYGGEPPKDWCDEFHRSFQNVIIIAGNHDVGLPQDIGGSINDFIVYCPFPLEIPFVGVYGKQFYFDYPEQNPLVRFILISPNLPFMVDDGELYDYSNGSARYRWTERAIDGAREAGIPWVFVMSHKNCIAAGEHGCEIGTDLTNLLIEKKVDIIWQGHNHHYERSKQLSMGPACGGIVLHVYNPGCVVNDGSSGQYTKGMGPVLVITGTGGRELIPFNTSDHFAPYIASYARDVNDLGKGIATFHLTRDRIVMETHFNRTYQDTFTVVAPPLPPSFFDTLPQSVPFAAPVVAGGEVFLLRFLVRRRRHRKPSAPMPAPGPPAPRPSRGRAVLLPTAMANGGTHTSPVPTRRFILDESGALRLED